MFWLINRGSSLCVETWCVRGMIIFYVAKAGGG